MSPRQRLLLLATFLAGFAVRVVNLDGFSLWLDELIQVGLAQKQWADFPAALTYGANMPADFLATKMMLGLGGQEFWLRLPAVFVGLLSIALIFAVARSFAPAPAPAFTALLLAFSPLAVQYSREVRPYSLFLALSLLSAWLYLAAIKRPEAWMGYVVAMLALLHTHLFGLAMLPVHGLHWLVISLPRARKQRRLQVLAPGFSAFAVILAIFLLSPFRPDYLFRFGSALVQGLSGPTAAERLQIARATSLFPALGEVLISLPRELSGVWPWGLPTAALALLGAVSLRKRPAALLHLLLWLLLPIFLILYSLAQRNQFYSPRYLICSLPPLLILTTVGLTALAAAVGRWLPGMQLRRSLPYVAVLFLVLALVPNLAKAREPRYEDWRAAAGYLQPRLTDRSAVVIPAAAPYVRHYLPAVKVIDANSLDQIALAVEGYDDIYLLQSPYSQFPLTSYPQLATDHLERHFEPALDLYHFPASLLVQQATTTVLGLLPAELTTPSPADHIDDLRQFASQARSDGDWPSAIAALQTLIPLQSNDGNLWAELGFAYQQSNQPEPAVRAYRNSLIVDDANPWAHLLLSNLLRHSGQTAEAVEQGRRAVDLAPDLPEAWAALALGLHAVGQFSEAMAAFDSGLTLRPNDLGLRVGRAHAATAARSPVAGAAWSAVLDLAPPPDIAAAACENLADAHPRCQ